MAKEKEERERERERERDREGGGERERERERKVERKRVREREERERERERDRQTETQSGSETDGQKIGLKEGELMFPMKLIQNCTLVTPEDIQYWDCELLLGNETKVMAHKPSKKGTQRQFLRFCYIKIIVGLLVTANLAWQVLNLQ